MHDASTPVQTAQTEWNEEQENLDQYFSTKWIIDGVTTLADAAIHLRKFAAHLDDLGGEGYELRDAIDGGVGY